MQNLENEAFGWAQKENLKMLGKELRENAYQPSLTTKTYIPKSSGLLRPITILRARDNIVYQAMANVLAEKAKPTFNRYYRKVVFSNFLNSSQYPVFFRKWQYGYKEMNMEKEKAINDGYTWIGELDVTSFYDLIDHELLFQLLTKLCGNEEQLYHQLRGCLSKWTVWPRGLNHGHGIPQGPLASSFLAECVLHFLDNIKPIPDTKYYRYVDDIFMMAKSEHAIRTIFARVEMKLRELALAPHIKIPIQQIDAMDPLIFSEPSILQNIPPDTKPNATQVREARKIFLSCFRKDGKLRRDDKLVGTKLNYSLFRMEPDHRILGKVLSLVQIEPSSTDAIHFHLRKYGVDRKICDYLIRFLNGDPMYEYAIANCLQTLNSGCAQGTRGSVTKFCLRSSGKTHNPYLRGIAVSILGVRHVQTKRLTKLIDQTQDAYVAEHLILAISSSALPPNAIKMCLNRQVRSPDANIAMVAAYFLSKSNLTVTENRNTINPWATPILKERRLINKRIVGDPICDILKARFRPIIPSDFSFRRVLAVDEYRAALTQLSSAEGYYFTNRSLWVTHIDNFNQMLLSKAYLRTGIAVNIDSVFGSIDSTVLRTTFPSVAVSFKECHAFRVICLVPHLWSRTLGTFSREIKIRERDKILASLRSGYQEFARKIS